MQDLPWATVKEVPFYVITLQFDGYKFPGNMLTYVSDFIFPVASALRGMISRFYIRLV